MKKLYFILFSIILINNAVRAQNELSGSVKDSKDGTPIIGASIYIPDLKIGSVSNENGIYTIKNIPNGNYLLEVRLIGYSSQTHEIKASGTLTQDFNLEPSSIESKEVIITGVASATEQESNPVPINTISQDDFLQNSSSNIIDAIAKTPGVSQITEGPAISKPVIRGLGYNRVVVINDGVRQEGQQWGDEFGIEVDEYSVDKVEIMKGPASLSYGSDAMAGVINMLSAPTLPEAQIKGSLLSNYQTNNGLFGNSLNLAGKIKGFTWDLRYTNKRAHNFQNKYDGYVWNSAYGENDVKGTIGVNGSWGYSRLTLSSFDLKLGIVEGARDSATGKFTTHSLGTGNTDVIIIAPDNKYTAYNFYPIIHQNVRHYKAVLDNSIAMGSGRLGLKLGYQQNYRQEANDITKGDIYNNYFFLRTLNYDVRYIFPESNHLEISVGTNGMQQASADRGLVYLVPEYNLLDMGVFSIAKKTFDKLSISGGIRYDLRALHSNDLYVDSGGTRLSGNLPNSLHRFTAYNSNFKGFSGSVGATYDFTKNLYGKLNLSRGFRAPTIAESGANGIHDGTPFYEIGDPNLKPESSLQVDLTAGVNTQDITVELNGFSNQINNYIFPVKLGSKLGGDSVRVDLASGLPAGPTFKYVSGDAVLSGGEVMLDIHPHTISWLHFENAFSILSAIQKNQGDSTKYLPYTPPFKYQSELKFVFRKANNTFKNAYLKVGMNYYFKQDKIYYKFGNETVTPAYTLLSAGIGTDICAKGRTICSIYILGNNLFDVAYQSNMSRLKYSDPNHLTGRVGVYEMGRNISFKLVIPIDFKKA